MDSEKITAFVQEHWNIILIVAGVVLIVGAALNWNWLCDPTGACRNTLQFFTIPLGYLLGGALVVVSVWNMVLAGR
jgi:uncharacterized membrane protein YidH (DUF202 family)